MNTRLPELKVRPLSMTENSFNKDVKCNYMVHYQVIYDYPRIFFILMESFLGPHTLPFNPNKIYCGK